MYFTEGSSVKETKKVHVGLSTPSLSTNERLQPRPNVQSVVGTPTLDYG